MGGCGEVIWEGVGRGGEVGGCGEVRWEDVRCEEDEVNSQLPQVCSHRPLSVPSPGPSCPAWTET